MRAERLRMALLGAAAASALAGPAAADTLAETVHWQIDADRGYSPDVVQFTLSSDQAGRHNMVSSPTSLNVLSGLSAGQLQGAPKPVAFRVQRDAGEFDCRGTAGAQHAAGDCVFRGSQSFAQVLASRGAGPPTSDELYRMSMHNVGADYLQALKDLHYPTPSAADLARAGEHGVSLRYIHEMAAAGFPAASIDALILCRDHGVDAAYVEAMRKAGYGQLPAEQLVLLRDHGVSGAYMDGLRKAGYGGLPTEQAILLRDHGVSTA